VRPSGPLWWIHNPVGKVLVDAVQAPFTSALQKAAKEREQIVKTADEVASAYAATPIQVFSPL